MDQFSILQLVALVMCAVLIFPSFLYYARKSGSSVMLRNIALWLGIALIIALLYQFFGPFS